jgi:catalase
MANAKTLKRQSAPSLAMIDRQRVETDAVSSKFAVNENKADEYGRDCLAKPPEGAHVELPSDLVSSSTLAEQNFSAKSGKPPSAGASPASDPLTRVRTDASGQRMTTNQGVPIADNQVSLKAGLRGPALLKDFILREKITHFDHERIPERIVHARGSGAHGYFESYASFEALTRASLFAEKG